VINGIAGADRSLSLPAPSKQADRGFKSRPAPFDSRGPGNSNFVRQMKSCR